MTAFNWLHLTDLHLGVETYHRLWPNVEEDFFEDLEFVVSKVGPLDLVVFTGDLAYRGSSEEFDLVNRLLERFWAKFDELGFDPKLLAVPGNHDLVRPNDAANPALINLLHLWENRAVQDPFWNNADSDQRLVVDKAFANYMEWWRDVSVPQPKVYTRGILPGDFAATLEKDGLKLGILGLNTSFLQLTDGDFKGKLALDVLQFHAACSGHGPDWAKKHDANLLLTHHPPDWLTEKAKEQLDGEIYRERRFAVHLFGHLHEPEFRSIAVGGADARRRLQGCSLFAVEGWGEHKEGSRVHGYSVGQLSIDGDTAALRICPRKAVRRQGGGWNIERDTSFTLPKDESMTEATPITMRPRTRTGLTATDDEQRKATAAREALQVALDAWRNEGIPESAQKLNWFYQYHQSLDLNAEGLVFLLLSQNLSAHSSSFGAYTSSKVTRTRWVDSVDPTVCLQAVDYVLELRQAEDFDQDLARAVVSDICSASSPEVQKELVVRLKNLESHPEGTLLAQAYSSSTIPNEATLRYIQDEALLQMPVIGKRAAVYRILEHYRRTFAPFIGRQQENLRESFPNHLLEDTSFQDAAFHYVDETSDSRRRVAFEDFKLELLQMLYGYDPSRTIEALWKLVHLDVFYIGETTRKALQLLRVYDPERTVREVITALREEQRYYSDESITILEFLEEPEADELLIGNIRRYAEKFTGGSKRWRGRYLPYWRASLRQTVQAAVRRKLGAIKPYLMAIVLRHEPANVKVSCVNALIAVGSEEEVWPTLVKLLNDRSAQVRKLCTSRLSRMKQHRQQVAEEVMKSLSGEYEPEPKWPFLSNRHKSVMLAKIDLLWRLKVSRAVELFEGIARTNTDEDVVKLAVQAATSLRQSTENPT